MKSVEIINEVLSHLKIKAPTFAKNIGEKYQRIYDIQKGKTLYISQELADIIISKYPEFRKSWLLTGEGEMLKNNYEIKSVSEPAVQYINRDEKIIALESEIEDLKSIIEGQRELIETLRKTVDALIDKL